jgi:hypothetical protein
MSNKTLIVTGKEYHNSKTKFKAFLKKNHLKWSGNFESPKWSSKKVVVKATFVRDPKKDTTTEAQFIITGEKTPFPEICQWIVENMSGKEDGDKAERIQKQRLKEILSKFDCFHKPNMDYLKSVKAPPSYIKYRFAEYEKKRAELIAEVKKEPMPDPEPQKPQKPIPTVGVWKS